jgi:hypothetical protein
LARTRSDIYNTNLGEASRRLEESRAAVTRAVPRLDRLDRQDVLEVLGRP